MMKGNGSFTEYEQNLRETNGNKTLVECSTRFQRLLQDVSQQSADRKKLNKPPMSYVMAMRVYELNRNITPLLCR